MPDSSLSDAQVYGLVKAAGCGCGGCIGAAAMAVAVAFCLIWRTVHNQW